MMNFSGGFREKHTKNGIAKVFKPRHKMPIERNPSKTIGDFVKLIDLIDNLELVEKLTGLSRSTLRFKYIKADQSARCDLDVYRRLSRFTDAPDYTAEIASFIEESGSYKEMMKRITRPTNTQNWRRNMNQFSSNEKHKEEILLYDGRKKSG